MLTELVHGGALLLVTPPPTVTTTTRRPSLDRATIVDTALRLTATPGVDTLSLRKLGVALGADPTAVYRHFADRDDLMCAVIDRLIDEVCDGMDQHAPWDAQLMRSAELTWEVSQRHPAVGLEMAAHTTAGAGERRSVEIELNAWRAAGLDDDDVVRFYSVFSSLVLNGATMAAANALATTHMGRPEDTAWIGDLADIDAEAYPLIAHYRAPLQQLRLVDAFLNSVSVVIAAARSTAAGYRTTVVR